jgi:cyclase
MPEKPRHGLPGSGIAAVLLFCSALAFLPHSASAQNGELTALASGIYARVVSPDSNSVSNAGVIVLEHSVVVFDTHFTPEAGEQLLSRIQALTPKPVRYVVNSHYHPDHTHGNQAFPGTPLILGSSATRRDMLQIDQPSLNRALGVAQEQLEQRKKEIASEPDPRVQGRMRADINTRQALLDKLSWQKILAPVITVDDSLSIWDGREVRLMYLGAGHTDGDVVLYAPAEKIVFAGDLFFKAGIPNVQDANLLEWMKTLQELLKIDSDCFVPGHGAPGTKEDVREFAAYFDDLKGLVEPAVMNGDTLEQVLETPVPEKFSAWNFQNLFRSNLEKMYKELKARQAAAAPAKPEPGTKP